MGNVLCINQSTIMECRTEAFLDACGNAGFHAVELRVPKLRETCYSAPQGTVEELLAKFDIRVVALNSIDDFALVPDNYLPVLEAELQQVGHLCRLVACDLVVAPAGRWFDGPMRFDEMIRRSAARLRLAAGVLADFGVSVGLEPIAFPEFTVKDLRSSNEIIDRCESKNVVLVADVYNLANGGTTPDEIKRYLSRVALVHINDAQDVPTDQRHVMYSRAFPGDGTLPVIEWINTCIAGGYTGPFSLELFDKAIWNLPPGEAAGKLFQKLTHFFAALPKPT